MLPNGLVPGNQRHPAGHGVGSDQSIERIARPSDARGGVADCQSGNVRHYERHTCAEFVNHGLCRRRRPPYLIKIGQLQHHERGHAQLLTIQPSLHGTRDALLLPSIEPNQHLSVNQDQGATRDTSPCE